MNCCIYHFSGVMKGQNFGDPESKQEIDLTGLSGTDLYCDPETEAELLTLLRKQKEAGELPQLRFFDSGNYHYMSKLLASLEEEPYTLINFDHHTDMQPSGLLPILSCGSWIVDLLRTDTPVTRVLSIGPPELMVQEARMLLSEEREAFPIMKSMETKGNQVWKQKQGQEQTQDTELGLEQTQEQASESVLCHAAASCTNSIPPVLFIKESELQDAKEDYGTIRDTIRYKLRRTGISGRIYVSIDKDVLSKSELDSTWDQGILTMDDLMIALDMIREAGTIVAMDVCGEPTCDASEEEIAKSEEINKRLYEYAMELFD